MQDNTAAGSEDEFPQPRIEETVYHAVADVALGFGRPQLKTLPDSGMNPAAMGSSLHA